MPSIVLPLRLNQTFPPMIWIFTEGEGGGIKSRLSCKIFYFARHYDTIQYSTNISAKKQKVRMFPKKLFHPIVVWKQSFSSSKTSSIIDNGFGLVGTNPLLSWQENVIAYLKEALVLFSIPSDGPFVCAYVWLASITTTRTICIPSCIGEIRRWGKDFFLGLALAPRNAYRPSCLV